MLRTLGKKDPSRGVQGLGGMLLRGSNSLATFFGGPYQGDEQEKRLRCGIRKLRYLRWDSLNIDENSIRFEKDIWVKLSIRIVVPTL